MAILDVVTATVATRTTKRATMMGQFTRLTHLIIKRKNKMFASYLYPTYRSWGYGFPGIGFPSWGYGGYGGHGRGIGINAVGSAIANQQLFNTGTMTGVSQIATPTAIW